MKKKIKDLTLAECKAICDQQENCSNCPIRKVCDDDTAYIYYLFEDKAEDLYFNIYGAIWTDKGLIYVAKVNEKREWELI